MIVLKRKKILTHIIVFLLLVASCIGMSASGYSTVFYGVAPRKLPVYAVATDEKKIALSFDASWGADKTKQIVDMLVANNMKATFFLVGFWINKYPDLVKYIYANGMEIGNHSHNHLKMSMLNADDIAKELNYVQDGVYKLTGKKPVYFRPPYGDYNDRLITETLKLGLFPVQWSIDSLDWKGLSGGEIASRVTPKLKPGSIILCHNNSDHILEALPLIMQAIKVGGYRAVNMSELVYTKNYTIDTNGLQHYQIYEKSEE